MIVVFYIAFCLIRYTTASLSTSTARIFLLFLSLLLLSLYCTYIGIFCAIVGRWAERPFRCFVFLLTVLDVDLGFCPVLIPF